MLKWLAEQKSSMITNWYHERSVRNKMVYLKTIGKNTGGSQREKMRDDSESSWMGYQIVLKKLLQLQ